MASLKHQDLYVGMRALEFKLPGMFQHVAHYCGLVSNPYTNKDIEMNAIFIHIPKSAGRSIRTALWHHQSFHIPAIRYKYADKKRFENSFKFSIVRNPWDRFLSAFFHFYRKKSQTIPRPENIWAARTLKDVMGFEDFCYRMEQNPSFARSVLKSSHFRSQMDWVSEIYHDRPEIIVDYLGRFERLPSDFHRICEKLSQNVPLGFVGGERQQGADDFRAHYLRSEMVDIVARLYKDDIRYFKYSFE